MEKLKDNVIQYALVKYAFHFLLFVAFFFAAEKLYSIFQNFLINTFSKIAYHGSGQSWFFLIFLFAIVCYGKDFSIVRKYGLRGYTIIYLVPFDICCLFISNSVVVFYTNIVFAKAGWAGLDLLTNGFVVVAVVVLKNQLVEHYLKRRKESSPNNDSLVFD
jgi:hypothetical protein